MKLLLFIAVFITLIGVTSSVPLWEDPTYFIVGPKRVHPNDEIKLLVSILRLEYPAITVRASVRNNREEYTSASTVFDRKATKMMEMRMPEKAGAGKYYMRIEGSIDESGSGVIFSNETELIFDSKRVSIFIHLNKLVYTQTQTVYLRAVPVQQNLMPAFGMVNVYVKDATGTVVRRWMSQQTNAGVINLSFKLSDQPSYGDWQIMLEAFGDTYTKDFSVIEYFRPRFDVNVTMPTYIRDNGIGLPVIISANLTSGYPVRGNATVVLTINDKRQSAIQIYEPKTIQRDILTFTGRYEVFFTMDELRYLTGTEELAFHELWVNVTIRDWFLLENQTGYAYSFIYGSKVHMTFLGGMVRTFKPGMIYTAYLAVARLDGAPIPKYEAQYVRMQRLASSSVSATPMHEEKIVVPDDGIIRYTFIPPDNSDKFVLRAFFGHDDEIRTEQHSIRAYSPTNSYIQISTMTSDPKVNEYMIFQIQSSHYVNSIYYQIIAGGRIIVGDNLVMTSKVKTFAVALSRDMSPMAHIVAYYIRYDREVVVDALNFFVNGTAMYKVDLKINKGKDFSGHTVEVIGITDPGVFLSVAGIDRDQYIHGGNPFLEQYEVIKELSTFDSHANSSFSYTWRYSDELKHTVYFPSPTYGVDANSTFEYSGLFAFTDANVTGSNRGCNISQGLMPCLTYQGQGQECYAINKKCDGAFYCADGTDEMGCNLEDNNPQRGNPFKKFNLLSRHHEDTSFMWNSFFTKPNGQVEFNTKVPLHIPIAWVLSAFAMSPVKGLGLMIVPRMFDHVQALIMTMEMPTHAVKGEQIGVRVVLSNYWDDYYEVLLTLHRSPKYSFVNVEGMGVVDSYKPRVSNGDVQTLVYVEPGQSVMLHFPILPIVQGNIDVTITSATFLGGDTITRSVFVVFDGVTKYYHTPYLTDLLKTGSNILPPLDIKVRQQFVHPEKLLHLYVPGSAVARVSVVGDVVGPGFFANHLDSENLMYLPYGCGEQAGFNFAVNLYYLYFLQQVSALELTDRKNALDYMNIALQRIMGYYNKKNGYFTVFRDHDKPSVWFSAFIVQTLHRARNPDWEYESFIPIELLNKVALWLVDQQYLNTTDTDNGVFREIGPIYDQKMATAPRYENGKVIHTDYSLTAYVLIALHDLKDLTGEARTTVSSAATRAGNYLGNHLEDMTDAFELAITAWALRKSGHSKAGDAYVKMMNASTTGGEYKYWTNSPIPDLQRISVDTIPHLQPKNLYPNEGLAVQATSYAILTLLISNQRNVAYESMTWLQSIRNSIGGFASTQDSIVALQALSEYARQDDSRSLYNIQVTVGATSIATWERVIKMNKKNFLKMQSVDIPIVWGNTHITVEGTGLANIMLDVWVNVEHAEFMRDPGEGDVKYFSLDQPIIKFHGKNFSIMDTKACASWQNTSLSAKSGMTVLQVDLPTGYVIMNDVLRRYVQSNKVKNLRRAEFYGKQVRFYFEYMNEDKTCVDFRADRWFPVANMTIQHKVLVYDYYEPGRYNSTLYDAMDLFNLNICLSCGSFQCPYCPYYNAATVIKASISLVLTIVALFITRFLYRT